MLSTSTQYKNEFANDNKNFINKATITLRDNTVLQVDSSRIMQCGVSYSDSTSSVGNFDVGAAIVNTCELSLLNEYDDFSEYDFEGARVIPYVGLTVNGDIEWLKKGEYTVDKANYISSSIILTCEDNMRKFDRDFADTNIKLPVTAFDLLQRICDFCGVTLKTTYLKMGSYSVKDFTKESISCRDVIIYIAQIEGAYARMNQDGYLELKWYNTSVFEDCPILDGGDFVNYDQTGIVDGGDFKSCNQSAIIDGGTFQALNDYHHIYSYTNPQIAVDPVIITGIQIDVTEDNETTTYLTGEKEYVIAIQNNPLITKGTVKSVADHLKKKIVGMRFRPLSVNALGDPSREAGDPAYVTDRKGNTYQCYITNISYTIGNTQNISCDAKSAARNSAKIYSELTKNIVRDKEQTREEIRKTADGKNAIYTGNKNPVQPRENDIWYKEIDDRLEMWIYDGTKWVLEASDLTGGEVKKIADEAKTAAAVAQKAGDDAKTAADGAKKASETAIKDSATAVINANAAVAAATENSDAIVTIRGDMATQSQITQLDKLVNLRVKENDVINQINLSNESILIAGNKIHITGKTTIDNGVIVTAMIANAAITTAKIGNAAISSAKIADAAITTAKIGNAAITDAKIGNVSANKVNTGTLNGKVVNVININASNISTGFMLADRIRGGTLLLGGLNNENGLIEVVDGSGNMVATVNADGFVTYSDNRKARLNYGAVNFSCDDKYAGDITSNVSRTVPGIQIAARYGYVAIGNRGSEGGSFDYKYMWQNSSDGPNQVNANHLFHGRVKFYDSMCCSESKSRVVKTGHYGEQLQYCYEMATPFFGDIGEGRTDNVGVCYVDIDDIFQETVSCECSYHVFLQKEGSGDLWVDEKSSTFFVVKGTPNLAFSWELKVRQRDYEYTRMGIQDSGDLYEDINYADIGVQILKDYYKEMEEVWHGEY